MEKKKWTEQISQLAGKEGPLTSLELGRLEAAKARLLKLQIAECRAAALRARVVDLEQGERHSAYFLGLEKQKQNRQIISELKNSEGKLVTDRDSVEQVSLDFYEDLFK